MFAFAAILLACDRQIEPFSPSHIDRVVTRSQYPVAVDPSRIGQYPGLAKSGAGYFYDDVLEYRVWMHPERGAARRAGDRDYFAAFAQYEHALTFSRKEPGAEEPLALVRQKESINEPTPGKFEWKKAERITEWNPEWLKGSRRTATSIPDFLAASQLASSKAGERTK
jgi:hypothetical protein